MLGWFKKKFSKSSQEVSSESVDLEKDLPDVEVAASTEKPSVVADEAVEQTPEQEGDDASYAEVKPAEEVEDSPTDVPDSNDITVNNDTVADNIVDATAEDNAPVPQKERETPVVEPAVVEEKVSFFKRLKNGLSRTRESLINRLDSVFLGKKVIDADLLDELEEILITADLGVQTVLELLDDARSKVARKELSDPQALKSVLKEKMLSYLTRSDNSSAMALPETGPFVILVLGVNGVGKTTTIGKLAHKFKQSGSKVMMVAADTFRAAAIDQIKVWGDRIGVEVCAQQPGADPSSVVYDAFDAAKDQNYDVIIVDTAGRIHTKVNLMEELKKIKRVMTKKCPGAPHEVMLVLDATTGQNAISQTKEFNKAVDITGLTLTKLDGTAKGGIVVNISREFDIPIRFIGVGEQMDDLRDFDSAEFVKALFDK